MVGGTVCANYGKLGLDHNINESVEIYSAWLSSRAADIKHLVLSVELGILVSAVLVTSARSALNELMIEALPNPSVLPYTV